MPLRNSVESALAFKLRFEIVEDWQKVLDHVGRGKLAESCCSALRVCGHCRIPPADEPGVEQRIALSLSFSVSDGAMSPPLCRNRGRAQILRRFPRAEARAPDPRASDPAAHIEARIVFPFPFPSCDYSIRSRKFVKKSRDVKTTRHGVLIIQRVGPITAAIPSLLRRPALELQSARNYADSKPQRSSSPITTRTASCRVSR